MKELRELVYTVSKHSNHPMRFIDQGSDEDATSKLQRFYEAVSSGEITTDQAASVYLYGETRITSKYRNLKYELKKRLLDHVFTLSPPHVRDRDTAFYECWKDWAACQILAEKSARNTAVEVAKRILKKTLRYDFLGLASTIALFLRNHYALREKNKTRFLHYDEIYETYRREEEYNNKAHRYYQQLILDHALDSVTANPRIQTDAQDYLRELQPLSTATSSVKFHYYLYQIELLGVMGVFDYTAAKKVCQRAIAYLSTSKIEFNSGKLNFLLNKLVCHIQLRELTAGKQTAIACHELVVEGTFNWFKTYEYLFILSCHTKDYQAAYEDYHIVINHPRYKSYGVLHETWSLYKMYLHFLYLLGEIQIKPTDRDFSALRLGKFLNEVPSFSKDKQGMNIPVLIIQMALLILYRKYDLAEERIDALNKYCDRYLKANNPNFRSNCFIKMLLQIPKSGFHRNGVKRRADRYLERMNTIAINFNNQAHEIEIIPFDDLWQLILRTLDVKFVKTKKSAQ